MAAPARSRDAATATAADDRPFPLHTGIATVTSVTRITPRMARITLGGDAVAGFPDEQPGEILTLIWPAEGAEEPVFPLEGWRYPPGTPEQHARNYTIRAYGAGGDGLPCVTIDVVLHGDHAIASRWAGSVAVGDTIGIGGPRVHFFADPDADYTLLAGDETALPSIAATLERLPRDHRALAFIEVADAAERQAIEARCDAEITWIHRDGTPAGRSTRLLDTLRAATLPPGRAKVWVAGESLAVRGLREHLRDERGLTIGPMQAIGYWKHRDTPDDVD
jgi:NADPH-dependent ferric siderophore reductase